MELTSNTNKESEYENLGVKSINLSSSKHMLNSQWSFWYTSRKEKDHKIPYEERLKKIIDFNSLEDFFRYYMYFKSAAEIDKNTDLSIFKEGYKPLWEACPEGGCWFIRFKKNEDPIEISIKWEKLIFALIGEQFGKSNILGAVLSIRGRETIVELWFSYKKDQFIKNIIGQTLKEILDLDNNIVVFFKENEKSLKDQSTLKNAESYNFAKRKNTYN